MIQGVHGVGLDYNYELEVHRGSTEVRFSFVNGEDGQRYTSHFISDFKKHAQESLRLYRNPDGIQLFALKLESEKMHTSKFFVPTNPFSEVVVIVLNRWARETGAPFAFRLAPGALTILEVTLPDQIYAAIKADVANDMSDVVREIFSNLTISKDEVTEEETELDLLDDENAVIVEEDEIDTETKDGFKSSLYADIEGGAEEDE